MKSIIKALLLAGESALAVVGTAAAADLTRPMYTKAPPPPPPPVLLWTGFYVGGNVGAAWTNANVTTSNAPGVPGIFGVPANIALVSAAGTGSLNSDAFVTGGVQVGYNWQVSPTWLVGVEADINALSHSQTLAGVAATTIGPFAVTNTLSTDWLATFRGRIGLTFNDWLLYTTGGAALTEEKLTNIDGGNLAAAGIVANGASSATSTKLGWTVGVGAEKLFGRWSVKAEYLFARFGGLSTTTTVATVPGTFTQIVTATTDHLDVNIARVGINYHFH